MKRVIFFISTIILTSSSVAAIKNKNYCFSENRRVASQEIIDSAIYEVISRQKFSIPKQSEDGTTHYFVPYEVIEYKTAREFLEKNSGCCKIVTHSYEGWTPSYWQKISGQVSNIVKMNYLISYRETENSSVEKYISTKYVEMDRCRKPAKNLFD